MTGGMRENNYLEGRILIYQKWGNLSKILVSVTVLIETGQKGAERGHS